MLKRIEAVEFGPLHLDEPHTVAARAASFRNSGFRKGDAVFAPDCRAEGAALIGPLQRGFNGKRPLRPGSAAV